ncbi:MAG TPA: DUF362 domain-containing protein [Candidatus Paceibacterota bacterium]|nr:DUF362 domain-containing protein [Verrucomicrobiota bacterium]HRZ45196.1 DUF362 domain-containing protein [Candidatus Paceibacterota bacterium]
MNTHDLRFSRRDFFWAAAGLAASTAVLRSQERPAQAPRPAGSPSRRSAVSVSHGSSRRANVCEALVAIEDQILPVLKTKKHVVIKPNMVSTSNQLASTHADALHGILDFLGPRFRGPVVIAESSAGYTTDGFDRFGYVKIASEHRPIEIRLADLNEEGKYLTHPILNGDLHMVPVRLAARLLDPDAYIFCCAILKTHNAVVATLSIKNMCLGAPLHSARGETPRWNDKRVYHGGVRQTHLDIALTAQRLQPCWGAAVLDGWEGMEGNGPGSGTAVPSRIAIASTDYVAADRVGLEAMGIQPGWIGYLGFCAQAGLGQDDLAKIDIRGARMGDVSRKYRMHDDIERELRWMGPMKEIPEKLG